MRAVMMGAALAIAGAGHAAFNPDCANPGLYQAGKPYRACLAKQAQRLEPSGEMPSDIANASFAGCHDDEAVLTGLLEVCRGDAIARGTMVKTKSRLRDDLVALVVSIRSARARGR